MSVPVRICTVLAGSFFLACSASPIPTGPDLAELRAHCREQNNRAFRQRCFTAVDDLVQERHRIRAAQQAFASDREDPTVSRDYLVSFQHPVAVRPLLDGLGAGDDAELLELHVWIAAEGASSAPTWVFSPENIGWPASGPEDAAAAVDEEGLEYLRLRRRGIVSLFGAETRNETIQQQLEEARAAERRIREHGSLAYGMRCRCSPAALERLAQAVPGLELRAVEEEAPYDQPIWPADVTRQRIIETRGAYGREKA